MMYVFPIVALALVVIVDVLAVAFAVKIADERIVNVRWGDIFYIHIIKWFVLLVFIWLAEGGDNIFTALSLVFGSISNGSRITSTIYAVGSSTTLIEISKIYVLEKISTALITLSSIMMTIACATTWMIDDSYPIVLTGAFMFLSVYAYKYCADVVFRTGVNLIYFALMFDNLKPRR